MGLSKSDPCARLSLACYSVVACNSAATMFSSISDLTTLKECGAHLIKVTRLVVGKEPAVFDTDTYQFGWTNPSYSQSDTRSIPSFGSFHIDLATLRILPNGRSEFFLAEC
jgi:hypothetical protein